MPSYTVQKIDPSVRLVLRFETRMENDMGYAGEKLSDEMVGKELAADELRKVTILPGEDAIREILRERSSKYGEYVDHAILTQEMLKPLMAHPNWHKLPAHMKETIHMNCHKLGRIVNGDPFYLDSWIDIIGYTQLTVDIIKEQKIQNKVAFDLKTQIENTKK